MNKNRLTFGDHFKYKESYCLSFGNLPGKRLVGFPRYIPSSEGRPIGQCKYAKLKLSFDGLQEALKKDKLKEDYAFYNYFGQEIFQFDCNPQRYYLPDEKLLQIISERNHCGLNQEVIEFYSLIQGLFRKRLKCGVGGSILLDCASDSSDIDLYFYEKNPNAIAKKIFSLFEDGTFEGLDFDKEAPTRVSNWARIFSGIGETKASWIQAYSQGKWVLEGYYKGRMFNLLFVLPRGAKEEKAKFHSFENISTEAKITHDSGALMRPSRFVIQTKGHGKVHLLSYVRTHSILRKGDKIRVKGVLQKSKGRKQITALWVEKSPINLIP